MTIVCTELTLPQAHWWVMWDELWRWSMKSAMAAVNLMQGHLDHTVEVLGGRWLDSETDTPTFLDYIDWDDGQLCLRVKICEFHCNHKASLLLWIFSHAHIIISFSSLDASSTCNYQFNSPLPSATAMNQSPLPSGDNLNSWLKRKVQAWVLQDQGISELGGWCTTEHCKEPDCVDEMVSCAGVGFNDQVCLLLMLCVVQVLLLALNSFI